MRRARFVPAARLEFLAEVVFYSESGADLGTRFVSAVQEATARALAFPASGSPAAADTRRIVLNGFPFSLVYRTDAEGIVVFALSHHKRRPNYWRSRVRNAP